MMRAGKDYMPRFRCALRKVVSARARLDVLEDRACEQLEKLVTVRADVLAERLVSSLTAEEKTRALKYLRRRAVLEAVKLAKKLMSSLAAEEKCVARRLANKLEKNSRLQAHT